MIDLTYVIGDGADHVYCVPLDRYIARYIGQHIGQYIDRVVFGLSPDMSIDRLPTFRRYLTATCVLVTADII